MDPPDTKFRQIVEQSSDLIEWLGIMSTRFCKTNRVYSYQTITELPHRLMWAVYLQALKYHGASLSVNYRPGLDNSIVFVSIGDTLIRSSENYVLRMRCPRVVRRPVEDRPDDLILERNISQNLEIPPVFRQYDWPRMKSRMTDSQRRLVKN